MSKPELTDLGKFNNNLDQLFDTLEKAYPEDTDLPYYKDKILTARKINSRMVVEQFLTTAEPHIVQIMTKQEDYFLHNPEIESSIMEDSYIKLMKKIRDLWLNMSPTSRDQIWKYFQIFITLAIKVSKRADLLPIINQFRQIPLTI